MQNGRPAGFSPHFTFCFYFMFFMFHFSPESLMAVPGNPNLQKVVVILSTGRTGTKALAHFFNTTYHNVTPLHEPRPSRHLRLLSNRAMAKGMTAEAAVRSLTKARSALLASLTRPIYIESNWYVYGFL